MNARRVHIKQIICFCTQIAASAPERAQIGEFIRYRGCHCPEKTVTPKSCSHCFTQASSLKEALGILTNQWSACEHCPHQPVMRVLIDKFQRREPRWWVVGGAMIVPIWIVEQLKKHRKVSSEATDERPTSPHQTHRDSPG
jgi:hypothetical protein